MPDTQREASIFRPGANCWRTARAQRLAVLVDGEEYFNAFAAAAERAERSILILAWDFNSRMALRVSPQGQSLLLGEFLNSLARRRPRLEVRVLIWDYPMIFGTDREFPPIYGLGWKPHRRVKVRYDNTHPVAACHHQKIAVIDDRVAFCGGIDLTVKRWDTREHRPADPRRTEAGQAYPPFHDVMMMVDGEAALALGALARERWQLATGRTLPPAAARKDPWPSDLTPLLNDVQIGISRSEPPRADREAVCEIESLYLDMIARARDHGCGS